MQIPGNFGMVGRYTGFKLPLHFTIDRYLPIICCAQAILYNVMMMFFREESFQGIGLLIEVANRFRKT